MKKIILGMVAAATLFTGLQADVVSTDGSLMDDIVVKGFVGNKDNNNYVGTGVNFKHTFTTALILEADANLKLFDKRDSFSDARLMEFEQKLGVGFYMYADPSFQWTFATGAGAALYNSTFTEKNHTNIDTFVYVKAEFQEMAYTKGLTVIPEYKFGVERLNLSLELSQPIYKNLSIFTKYEYQDGQKLKSLDTVMTTGGLVQTSHEIQRDYQIGLNYSF